MQVYLSPGRVYASPCVLYDCCACKYAVFYLVIRLWLSQRHVCRCMRAHVCATYAALHIPVKPCFHVVESVAVNTCWSSEATGSLCSPINRIRRIRWCRSNLWRERRSDSLSSLQLLRCQYLYFCTSKASRLKYPISRCRRIRRRRSNSFCRSC